MAVFRDVYFWPSTGFPDRSWLPDPADDAFVKSARRVCELYSEALVPARLQGPSARLQLMTVDEHQDEDAVKVEVETEFLDVGEIARVSLPDGIDLLTAEQRGLLVLDVVHGAVVRLAQARGWDVTAAAAARDHALNQQLVFTWAGPWKASRNRKYEARPLFRLQDDGYGRVRIEVRERDSHEPVARSPEALAFSTLEGFKRAATTLRWEASSSVGLVPYSGLLGDRMGDLRVALDGGDPHSELPEPLAPLDPALPRPRVLVLGRGPNAPEQEHQISVLGGGPMNDVPHRYHSVLDNLLGAVEKDFGPWWSTSDLALLEIEYWFGAKQPKIVLRRGKNRLRAFIHRPVQTLVAASDPAGLAVSDVRALLAAVAAKMRLPSPPPLPEARQSSVRKARAADARRAQLEQRADHLISSVTSRLPAAGAEEVALALSHRSYEVALYVLSEQWRDGAIELTVAEVEILSELQGALEGPEG